MIKDRIDKVRQEIEEACRKIGRDPQEITMVGVTKYAAAGQIVEAVEGGLTHIGENKVQQAQEKFPALTEFGPKVTRHMIGHLQTNKVKDCLELFDIIQSVDSLKLAEAISKEAGKQGRTADILVQVNTSGERQKFGVAPKEAMALIEQIARLPKLQVHGLMAMAPLGGVEANIRRSFVNLRELRERVIKNFEGSDTVSMTYLSMGMTDDFKIAIEEGSNMVRIGRAIFH